MTSNNALERTGEHRRAVWASLTGGRVAVGNALETPMQWQNVGMRETTIRMGIRVAVALIASWYGALLAFSLAFPQCSSGSFVDSIQTTCRIGLKDYGDLYREVVMFSAFGLAPIGFTIVVVCIVLETGLHQKTRTD